MTTSSILHTLSHNTKRTALLLLLLVLGSIVNEAWAKDYLYTYYIVNKRGVVSLWYAETQSAGAAPHIPAYIKSPLLPNDSQYHYYLLENITQDKSQGITNWVYTTTGKTWDRNNGGTADDAPLGLFTKSSEAVELSSLPEADTHIYVFYDDYENDKAVNGVKIDLTGETPYTIKSAHGYVYADNDPRAYLQTSDPSDTELYSQSKWQWTLTSANKDPYDIKIGNASATGKYLCDVSTSGQRSGSVEAFLRNGADYSNAILQTFALLNGKSGKIVFMGTHQTGANPDGSWYRRPYFGAQYNSGTIYNINYVIGKNQGTSNDEIQITIANLPTTYTYHLINHSGNEVLSYSKASNSLSAAISLYAPLKSAHATDFSIYAAATAATAISAAQSNDNSSAAYIGAEGTATYGSLPAGVTDIYIGYTTSSSLDLTGGTRYSICRTGYESKNWYMYTDASAKEHPCDGTYVDNDRLYLWRLYNGDPYNITIRSDYHSSDYYLSTQKGAFAKGDQFKVWANGSSTAVTNWSLIAGDRLVAFGTDGGNKYVGVDSNNYTYSDNTVYTLETDLANITKCLQMTFTERTLATQVKYRIVKKNGKQALTDIDAYYTSAVALPAAYTSPLVSAYHYYTATNVSYDSSARTITWTGEKEEIDPATYTPSEGEVIYVTYDANTTLDLTGATKYTLKKNNASNYIRYGNGQASLTINGITSLPTAIPDNYLFTLNSPDGTPDPYDIVIRSSVSTTSGYSIVPQDAGNTTNTSGIQLQAIADASNTVGIRTWALLNGNRLVSDINPYYGSNTRMYYMGNGYVQPIYMSDISGGTHTGSVVELTPAVTYHIVNLGANGNGTNRTEAFAVASTAATIGLPSTIKSPLATNWKYYKAGEFTESAGVYSSFATPTLSEGGAVGALTDIYVTYEYDASSAAVDLRGITRYNVQMNDKYWHNDSGRPNFPGSTPTADNLNSDAYNWTFKGNDPYNVKVVNVALPNGYLSGNVNDGAYSTSFGMYLDGSKTDITTFFWLGTDNTTGWNLMANTPSQYTPNGGYSFVYNESNNYALLHREEAGGAAADKIIVEQKSAKLTYHIVNKSNTIAISKPETSPSALSVPADIKTPYITADANYKAFVSQADAYAYTAAADEAARTAAAAKAITTLAEVSDGIVYVGYYYDEEARPAELPILDGSLWYQMINNGDKYWKGEWNSTLGNTSPNTDTTGGSQDEYLWKYTGNDPYAIYVSNKWLNNEHNGGNDAELLRSSWNNGGFYNANYAKGTPHGGTPHIILTAGKNDGSGNAYYNLAVSHPNGPTETTNYYVLSQNCRGYQTDKPYPRYHNPNAKALLQFRAVAMGNFRFHLKTHVSGTELTADVTTDYSTASNLIALPTTLERKFVTPVFYLDYDPETGTFSNPVTNFNAAYQHATKTTEDDETVYHLYVDYTAATPFEVSTDYEHATWYRLYNNNNHYARYTGSQVSNGSDNTYTHDYQFAFVGDPYELKIMNREAGAGKYLGVAAGSATSTIANFIADGITTWELVGSDFNADEFALREYGSAASPRYCAYSSGTPPLRYTTGTTRIKAVALPQFSYTFNIVDNKGRIAIKYTLPEAEKRAVSAALGSDYTYIPAAIRSHYLEDETVTFYATKADAVNGVNSISEMPSTDGADIYVRYTTAHVREKELKLGGARAFDMRINGRYVYEENETTLNYKRPEEMTEADEDSQSFLWYLMGGDPYAVEIENVREKKFFYYDKTQTHLDESGNLITLTTNEALCERFIIKEYKVVSTTNALGEQIDNIVVELMAASGEYTNPDTGDTYDAADHPFYLGRDETVGVRVYDAGQQTISEGRDELKIELNVAKLDITMYIVDKSGRIVIAEAVEDAETKAVPAKWVSPLVKEYHFWKESQFTFDGSKPIGERVYTLKGGETEIESLAEAGYGRVYVTYDVSDAIDLDGRNSERKQLYMLQFANGETFRQEKDNAVMDTKTKAVYPYSNGDANLNIYREDLWSEQQYAASTRTRWAWYVEGGDPYRAKISSFQTQTTEDGVARHAFLRTYQPEGYGSIVTGSITDNSRAVAAGALPTEYMILGATSQYLLVTTSEMGDDNTGYSNTNHRVVNSFEQYWKNSPTVEKIAGAEPEADNATLTGTYGWHRYKAFANYEPWGGGSKSYGGDGDHWFQTIRMDDGGKDPVFDFKPVDLNGVLILVDNHGWEVMRKPLGRTEDAATKATRDAAIRTYDSPMVAQYHFWTDFSKTPGYHQYRANTASGSKTKERGTGASLTDYPRVLSNGMLTDLYATYDVKPEYAESYDAGADAQAEGSSTTAFIIRQDGKLAKTTDGTTLSFKPVSETGIDAGNTDGLDDDNLYWNLKPNFTIDREMGYLYEGEAGANNGEQSLSATNASNYEQGRNGFDPYNLRIESKPHAGKFFTTDATAANLSDGSWTGNGSSVSLATLTDPLTTPVSAIGYDEKTCHITNATFMAIQDANGNMRLMPRFDHGNVVEGFTALRTPAAAQTKSDTKHSQTTLLYQNTSAYTYIVIDNNGREALRYQMVSNGAPDIPYQFTSALATGYKFYHGLSKNAEDRYDIDESTLDAQQITGSFSSQHVAEGSIIYVRYGYDASCDTEGLLKGYWYNVTLNGSDVKLDDDGTITKGTLADGDAAWQWRFVQRAGDAPDPYAIELYNSNKHTDGHRYIIMQHDDGAYALMQAGTGSYDYAFLSGSSATATIVTHPDYAVDGIMAADTKIRVTRTTPAAAVTYKIITHTGKVALTGADNRTAAVIKQDGLSLPDWMKSPLMKDEPTTYIFYPSATIDAEGNYAVQGEPTTNTDMLDDGTVYVRYDYEASKTPFTNFKFSHINSYITDASLDLTGQVPYVLSIGGGHNWQRIKDDKSIQLRSNGDGLNNDQERFRGEGYWVLFSWRLTGNDPYEITFTNSAYSDSHVLGVEEPTETSEEGGKLAYMVEKGDASHPYQTFMILKAKKDGLSTNIGLKVYVTGHDDWFMSENGNVRVWKDNKPYQERYATAAEPYSRYFYSRFGYRPNIVYHVITNEGNEVITAQTARGSDYDQTDIVLPQYFQSPLLRASDFVYYTERPVWQDNKLTVNEAARIGDDATVAQLVEQRCSDIYVRYNYNREASPFKIGGGFNTADDTRLDWSESTGLDLNGDTWYSMGAMQMKRDDYGIIKGTTASGFDYTTVKKATTEGTLSQKKNLWRLVGNDPYAIRIYNCATDNKVLTVNTAGNVTMDDIGSANAQCQSFMFLEHARQDNRPEVLTPDKYKLARWSVLHITSLKVLSLNEGNITVVDFKKNNYLKPTMANIRMSETEIERRSILSQGSGSTGNCCVEFVKAPVARPYIFHAIKYEDGVRGEEMWSKRIERDWLTPVRLDNELARLYCDYEKAGTSGSFVALDEADGGRFYRDAAMTLPVHDDNSNTDNVYPEIDDQTEYHIYFKYQVQPAVHNNIFWDEETLRSDINKHGQADWTADTKPLEAQWYMMVINLNAQHGTVKGRYFLRYEDQQTVYKNDGKGGQVVDIEGYPDEIRYTSDPAIDDTWPLNRISRTVESWREKGNGPWQEGRWLFAFTGDPYRMKVVNMQGSTVYTKEEVRDDKGLPVYDDKGNKVYTYTGTCPALRFVTLNTDTKARATQLIMTQDAAAANADQLWGLHPTNYTPEAGELGEVFCELNLNDITTLKADSSYWTFGRSPKSLYGASHVSDATTNAVKLIKYVPCKYEDVKIVIRHEDDKNEDGTSGIAELYYAASDRKFTAGDVINHYEEGDEGYDAKYGDIKSIPTLLQRKFCRYTIYSDVFAHIGDYEIKAGPYLNADGDVVDQNDNVLLSHSAADYDARIDSYWPQKVFASYSVTTDLFLKQEPTAAQLKQMIANNDHVYFMDFTQNLATQGYNYGQHAFYVAGENFKMGSADLNDRLVWNGTDDFKLNGTNECNFQTASNRMASVPENLKWYFVGDPYNLQVFCAHPDLLGQNLARFDETETVYQYVLDCVHLRHSDEEANVPANDTQRRDPRDVVYNYKEDGTKDLESKHTNPNKGKLFFPKFYWSMVPARSDDDEAFALRFQEESTIRSYRGIYYYLTHSGTTVTYRDQEFKVNLSYDTENAQVTGVKYNGYHVANDASCAIRLVQPVKVYVSAYNASDEQQTEDELSEYFGLGETLTDIPQHYK
ncbi:MAG: hypothetical protein IJ710_06930, partial [Prevotella sp.]|nr:hypothetical protein [Prevotella sp.]